MLREHDADKSHWQAVQLGKRDELGPRRGGLLSFACYHTRGGRETCIGADWMHARMVMRTHVLFL
jgi:hypothetical protein